MHVEVGLQARLERRVYRPAATRRSNLSSRGLHGLVHERDRLAGQPLAPIVGMFGPATILGQRCRELGHHHRHGKLGEDTLKHRAWIVHFGERREDHISRPGSRQLEPLRGPVDHRTDARTKKRIGLLRAAQLDVDPIAGGLVSGLAGAFFADGAGALADAKIVVVARCDALARISQMHPHTIDARGIEHRHDVRRRQKMRMARHPPGQVVLDRARNGVDKATRLRVRDSPEVFDVPAGDQAIEGIRAA